MDLAALQIFKTVVEQGGINKAAAKLHRVPSNVTTRIKGLEQQVGAKLFVRNGRGLVLSSEGKVLLAYAERLLQLSSEAEAALRNGKPRGSLRLGALESTSATRLPPVLSQYHLLYPDVQLELVTGTSGTLVSRVNKQEIDAAFVAEPFDTNGLESQAAFVEELVLITPLSFPNVRSAKDVRNRTVISFATGCSYRRRLESWLGTLRSLDRVMEFQSYHAIVACVAAGAGMAIVPRSVIEMTLGAHEVRISPLPAKISRARTQLVWRVARQTIALEALKKLLADPQLRKAA